MTHEKLSPICRHCAKQFEAVFPKQKFCCVPCAFWANATAGKITECWDWNGSRAQFGYGEFRYFGKLIRAHRYSFELHCGPIDAEQVVRHDCDNPRCCNPHHLSVGTQADNMNDRAVRYRGLKVMSVEQAKEIEAKLLDGQRMSDLAREYRVSHPTIRSVRSRMRRAGINI